MQKAMPPDSSSGGGDTGAPVPVQDEDGLSPEAKLNQLLQTIADLQRRLMEEYSKTLEEREKALKAQDHVE